MTLVQIFVGLLLVHGIDGKFTCLEDGEFEHPHSCYRYYICKNGGATVAKCNNRMYWKSSDPGKGSCVPSDDEPCYKRAKAKSVSAVSNTQERHRSPSVNIKISGTFNEPFTPQQNHPTFECPAWNGHYRDPMDCSRFFLCVDGTKYGYTCPVGMHFSLAGHCDYIYRINCAMERQAQSITNDVWSVEKQQKFDLASIIEMTDYESSGDEPSTKNSGYFSYETKTDPYVTDWDTESAEGYDWY